MEKTTFMETYTVYILYSERFDKYYIGQTSDPEARILLHNAGVVSSTKPYKPWKMVCRLEKETRSEAMILEKKLKNLNRARLEVFIGKYS
jgi:putative endonuclease